VAFVRDLDFQTELFRSGTYQRVASVTGQLQDFKTVERAINEGEIDTVFHLGAQAVVSTAARGPLGTWEANIRATYNVLEACRVHADMVKRVVIASSDKAYGEHGDDAARRKIPV
jgi:CDP-glucose 4,6-dehydratase